MADFTVDCSYNLQPVTNNFEGGNVPYFLSLDAGLKLSHKVEKSCRLATGLVKYPFVVNHFYSIYISEQ